MLHNDPNTQYSQMIFRKNWTTWIWSVLGAGLLNLSLFLVMPHLLDRSPSKPTIQVQAPRINVLHFKRKTDDSREDVNEPPESRKLDPDEMPKVVASPMPLDQLTLPFEVNTELPEGVQAFSLPEPEFDTSDLDATFTMDELDSPLTTLVRIPPDYPVEAKSKGIEGWARVRFLVDESGYVGNAVVMEADPPEIFNQSVVRCVSGWRFEAGTVGGVRVKTWAETTIWFDLEQ
jgi:periplasmic protein TonB